MSIKAPNPIDRHVGQRVRMRRMALGMSQEKLAEGLGVTFQQLQKYEKGVNRIGSSRLHHLAERLQVTVSFFFEGLSTTGAEASSEVTSAVAFLTSSDGLKLTTAFMSIKDANCRRSLVDMAQAMAKAA